MKHEDRIQDRGDRQGRERRHSQGGKAGRNFWLVIIAVVISLGAWASFYLFAQGGGEPSGTGPAGISGVTELGVPAR